MNSEEIDPFGLSDPRASRGRFRNQRGQNRTRGNQDRTLANRGGRGRRGSFSPRDSASYGARDGHRSSTSVPDTIDISDSSQWPSIQESASGNVGGRRRSRGARGGVDGNVRGYRDRIESNEAGNAQESYSSYTQPNSSIHVDSAVSGNLDDVRNTSRNVSGSFSGVSIPNSSRIPRDGNMSAPPMITPGGYFMGPPMSHAISSYSPNDGSIRVSTLEINSNQMDGHSNKESSRTYGHPQNSSRTSDSTQDRLVNHGDSYQSNRDSRNDPSRQYSDRGGEYGQYPPNQGGFWYQPRGNRGRGRYGTQSRNYQFSYPRRYSRVGYSNPYQQPMGPFNPALLPQNMVPYADSGMVNVVNGAYPIGYSLPVPIVDDRSKDFDAMRQVEYYFSAQNLASDNFMRSRMDSAGWVDLSLIYKFKRIQRLDLSYDDFLRAICASEHLEVNKLENKVRTVHTPEVWVQKSKTENSENLSKSADPENIENNRKSTNENEEISNPQNVEIRKKTENIGYGNSEKSSRNSENLKVTDKIENIKSKNTEESKDSQNFQNSPSKNENSRTLNQNAGDESSGNTNQQQNNQNFQNNPQSFQQNNPRNTYGYSGPNQRNPTNPTQKNFYLGGPRPHAIPPYAPAQQQGRFYGNFPFMQPQYYPYQFTDPEGYYGFFPPSYNEAAYFEQPHSDETAPVEPTSTQTSLSEGPSAVATTEVESMVSEMAKLSVDPATSL